jgi:hemerythrin-like domain-containing protein
VADYPAFFRGFADVCHHGKEEDMLAAFRPDPGRMAEAAQRVGSGAGR